MLVIANWQAAAVARSDVALEIAQLAGSRVLQLEDAANGWPALGRLRVLGGWVDAALFVAPVGPSGRGRDDVERRFQNPGGLRPIEFPANRVPLYLGLWNYDSLVPVEHEVLVYADARARAEKLTRFSIFPRISLLQEAASAGWAEGLTTTGEQMLYFHPTLLAIVGDAVANEVPVPEGAISLAVAAAGIGDTAEDEPVDRLRRLAASLVRDQRFSRRVLDAYSGRCAMCGLNSGLVEAAHIYPVSAPNSTDTVGNGIALCRNHHGAFDRHLILVQPDTWQLVFHPRLLESIRADGPAAVFVRGTEGYLRPPSDRGGLPDPEMFWRRYEYFIDEYDWAAGSLA